jgi:hypothetical protein
MSRHLVPVAEGVMNLYAYLVHIHHDPLRSEAGGGTREAGRGGGRGGRRPRNLSCLTDREGLSCQGCPAAYHGDVVFALAKALR